MEEQDGLFREEWGGSLSANGHCLYHKVNVYTHAVLVLCYFIYLCPALYKQCIFFIMIVL